MMKVFVASLLALAALATGPAAQAMPAAPAQPEVKPARGVVDSPRKALENRLRDSMPYAEFRRIALASGWVPVASDPPCARQVPAELCRQLPEIRSTSSGPTAYTELRLRHASGVTIDVLATGEAGRWQTRGEEQSFSLVRWSFE
jgi:hypothetical protein